MYHRCFSSISTVCTEGLASETGACCDQNFSRAANICKWWAPWTLYRAEDSGEVSKTWRSPCSPLLSFTRRSYCQAFSSWNRHDRKVQSWLKAEDKTGSEKLLQRRRYTRISPWKIQLKVDFYTEKSSHTPVQGYSNKPKRKVGQAKSCY